MSETVKEVSVSDRNDSTAREESCRTIEKESGVWLPRISSKQTGRSCFQRAIGVRSL